MPALTPYLFSFFSQSIHINTTQILEGRGVEGPTAITFYVRSDVPSLEEAS